MKKRKKLKNKDKYFVDENGQPYEVPLEGSLGLLAYGYKGIMVWRQKRKEHLHKILDQKIQSENIQKQ